MREESHLEEMRSAIRGDFERLADRRGDQELMRVVEDAADDDPVLVEPESAQAADAPEPEPGPADATRSWLARFLSP